MIKRILFPLILISLLLFSCATGKVEVERDADLPSIPQSQDWAGMLSFNDKSETVKCEVTVKSYVDGDTTHFFVPESIVEGGVLKARYLAINTPESTGKIEEWGKAASRFTKEKLLGAESIIIESDDGNWNLDSTGGRYLVWVWYKAKGEDRYRNLNLELLQEGLALPSSAANNRYGSWCQDAIADAKAEKKHIWSGAKDPDFFYGDAVEVTLKELRVNAPEYDGIKVAFDGTISANWNNSVYIEDYDEESLCSYGIGVYYGYSLSGTGLEILQVGNRVRIVGTVQYYAGGDTYQVSGLKYREMKPNDPGNIRLLEKGVGLEPWRVEPKLFNEGFVTLALEDEEIVLPLSEALLGTMVQMDGLFVEDVYTTLNEDSSSYGAMTLVCTKDGERIKVRTVPLYVDGVLLEERDFAGRIISICGVVDTFEGSSQIKVFKNDDITVL